MRPYGFALAELLVLVFAGSVGISLAADTANDTPTPFSIRGFKGCFWDGIGQYRLALPWAAAHDMNFLMLCYTSFPASAVDWRSEYTSVQKDQIRQLAGEADDLGVNLCLSFNPGVASTPPLTYSSEKDYQLAFEKVRDVHALGVRWFALCLDDISGELEPVDMQRFGNLRNAHVYFVNRLWDDMKALTPNPRLIFCPSAYCNSGPAFVSIEAQPEYIEMIGQRIDQEIMLFWTGPQVCSPSITATDARNVAKLLRRKPFVWDNYPVNDAFDWGPYMSPLKNRSAELADACAGYMANAMKQWHMCTIPLATTAQYLLDPIHYDPDEAIEKVICSYPPEQQGAIRLLVELYGHSFWGEPGFPPWPRPASQEDAREMLPRYMSLREELSTNPALHELWDDVRPMLEQNIEFLQRKAGNRRVTSPLEAHGEDFTGGAAEMFGCHHYGRTVNFVYAKTTERSEMSVPFYLETVPDAGAALRIVARGDGGGQPVHVQIALNDLLLVDGPSPFPCDSFESKTFDVSATKLKTGANLLTVRNMESEGPLGNRPWFMVEEAVLIPRR